MILLSPQLQRALRSIPFALQQYDREVPILPYAPENCGGATMLFNRDGGCGVSLLEYTAPNGSRRNFCFYFNEDNEEIVPGFVADELGNLPSTWTFQNSVWLPKKELHPTLELSKDFLDFMLTTAKRLSYSHSSVSELATELAQNLVTQYPKQALASPSVDL